MFIQDIVKDYDVAATTGHRAALTDEKGFTTTLRVPPTGGLGVHRQADIGEELLVLVFINKVTDHATEALGQFSGVGADDEFAVGMEETEAVLLALERIHAAPVSAEAIRAEALEEAAKVCRTAQAKGLQSIREAIEAAIRWLK